MSKFHKRLLLLVAFVLVISGAVIYFTVDINTLTNLTMFKPWSIALAAFVMAIGLVLDGSRLMHLVHIAGEEITFAEAVHVVFGNYFLALLTPGATGGAVAQLMFLRKANIPTGKATVIVFVRTIISILFLTLCMPFIFMHNANVLPGASNESLMMISGIAFLLIALMIWAVSSKLFDRLAVKIARRLSLPKRRSFIQMYRDTQHAVKMLSSSPWGIVYVFIESGISLVALFSVVPCLLLGLGVPCDWATAMGRMIFLNMLLYFMPTPGGSGVAEGGFVLLFSEMVPAGTVGIVAVCWRLIAEYMPFVVGFYYTVKVFGKDFLNKE